MGRSIEGIVAEEDMLQLVGVEAMFRDAASDSSLIFTTTEGSLRRLIVCSSKSADGQRILAQNGNRVNDPAVAAEFKDQFPVVKLVKVEDVFGSWDKVQKEHFDAGAALDQALCPR